MFRRIKSLTDALARRRGFGAAWVSVLVAALPSLLAAQSDLTGVVYQKRDAGFVPVAGARVEVRPAGGGEVLRHGETGSMGRYYIGGLAAGEFLINVTHPRYYMAEESGHGGRTVRCPSSGVCTGGDFEMVPTGELEVSVVDSLGLPVENASVQVRRLDRPERTLPAVLRAVGGIFRIPGMAPGRYRVEAGPVELRGMVYHRAALDLDFPRGVESHSVRMVMGSEREYRVAGRILGLDASDDQVVMVILEPEGQGASPEQSRLGAPVEPSGHFAVNGVPGGSYSLKLVWAENSHLDLAQGPSRLLTMIRVQSDVRGLTFAAPADLVSP